MIPDKLFPFRSGLTGGLLFCALLSASAASSIVTFQVDMNVAATNGTVNSSTQTVATHGTFNGWGTFNLTNDPSGPNPLLYSGTTNLPDNGNVIAYKYTIEPGATY